MKKTYFCHFYRTSQLLLLVNRNCEETRKVLRSSIEKTVGAICVTTVAIFGSSWGTQEGVGIPVHEKGPPGELAILIYTCQQYFYTHIKLDPLLCTSSKLEQNSQAALSKILWKDRFGKVVFSSFHLPKIPTFVCYRKS